MYHPPNGHLPPPGGPGPGRWQSTQLLKQINHFQQQQNQPHLHHQQQQHQQNQQLNHHHHQQQHPQQQQQQQLPQSQQNQQGPQPQQNQQHTTPFSYVPHLQSSLNSASNPQNVYQSHSSQQNPHPSYAHLPSPAPGHSALNSVPSSAHHQPNSQNQPQPSSTQQPPNNQSSSQSSLTSNTPITPSWAKQVEHAQISRASNAAHHHARAAQLQSRGQGSSALTITDPNRPPKPVLLHHNASTSGSNPGSNSNHHHLKSHLDHSSDQPSRNHPLNSVGNLASRERGTNPNSPTDTSTTSSSATANGPADSRLGGSNHHSSNSTSTASTSWTTVDMGGLKLKSLSDSLFNYEFLTTLYIPHNSLTSLSPLIAKLTSLTILDASSNKLTSLPPELGMITTLQHLFVFDNHLTSLPPELGSLHQLEELGVEGNPLTESLLTTIQKEGTASLVAYLRDSCPVPLPPAERDWIAIDSDFAAIPDTSRNSSSSPETFTTMCYNILCERYATDRIYGYTPSWALSWDYRKDLILQELMQYGADIICLQEVDVEQYEDFFVQNLKEQGYEGVFYPKSRARTMGSEERRHVDGCATFFKTAMFQLIERECVEFNQIPMRSESHKTEAMFNRVMTKDNIAVIALLENRQSGTRQVVANVHIHWDPEFRDVKLVQAAMLMDQIEQIANRFAKLPKRTNLGPNQRNPPPSYSDGSKIPTIICGDFNSVPNSGVYDYLTKGTLEGKHEDFNSHHYGPYTDNGVKHRLQLKSAYSHLGELPFTNYTPGFKGVIDYIWYSSNSLGVIGLLGKIDEKYLLKVVGFPNAHFASDHVPVLAEFRVKPV